MLTLHKGPAAFGVGDISPFCLKLESYLRMTGVPYRARAADFGKAPKGKIPFIEEDGSYLGDSQLIIEHLKREHGDPLDAGLGAEDIAKGQMVAGDPSCIDSVYNPRFGTLEIFAFRPTEQNLSLPKARLGSPSLPEWNVIGASYYNTQYPN